MGEVEQGGSVENFHRLKYQKTEKETQRKTFLHTYICVKQKKSRRLCFPSKIYKEKRETK